MARSPYFALPSEPLHHESLDHDPAVPGGYVLKLELKGGRCLYVHMSAAERERLRVEPLQCARACCAVVERAAA